MLDDFVSDVQGREEKTPGDKPQDDKPKGKGVKKMPISTVDQTLNIATRIVDASERLMNAWEDLKDLKDQKESSGIDFSAAAFLAAIPNTDLEHLDADRLNNVLTSTTALTTFLETNFHDDIFQQVRRGG